MTGNYPLHNGVLANDMRLDESSQSLGVVCRDAGYRTGYVGKWHIDGVREFTPPGRRRQGFDFWHKSVFHVPFDQPYYIQDDPNMVRIEGWAPVYATDTAIRFMQSHTAEPFALVVSYGPPHNGSGKRMDDTCMPGKLDKDGKQKYGDGYKAPPEFEAPYRSPEFTIKKQRANLKSVNGADSSSAVPGYFGSITSLDHEFGRLMTFLKQSGLDKNTIVIFTSDHGEMLGSHGKMAKCLWYEESVGVPCIIGGAGIKPRKIESPFNAVDVMPTLLGLLGVDHPPMDGADFSPLLTGKAFESPDYAFLSFYKGGVTEIYRQWRAVYSSRYTYVVVGDWPGWRQTQIPQHGGAVLYDRITDTYQMNPVYRGQGQDDIIDKMHAALVEHLAEQDDPFLEKIWVGRGDKSDAADKTSRYDALITRGTYADSNQ
jgi:arylsulfatase A-like enzyme